MNFVEIIFIFLGFFILPTLNEEENLKVLIPELVSQINTLQLDNYQILVVDDSSDDTEQYIKELNSINEKVDIYLRKENANTMSIKDGIENSKFDYVMWLDADGSMNAEAVKKLIEKQKGNPESVIVGSRFVEGGGYKGMEITERQVFSDV